MSRQNSLENKKLRRAERFKRKTMFAIQMGGIPKAKNPRIKPDKYGDARLKARTDADT